MAGDDEINVRITANAEGLSDTLDEASGQLESFAAPVAELAEGLGRLNEAFLMIDAVVKFVELIVELGKALEHAAEALGMTNQVAALNAALKDLGNSLLQIFKPAIETAITGLTRFVEGLTTALNVTQQAQLTNLTRQIDEVRAKIEELEAAKEKVNAGGGLVLFGQSGAAPLDKMIASLTAQLNLLEAAKQKLMDEGVSSPPPQTKPPASGAGGDSGQASAMSDWQEQLRKQLVEHNVAYDQMRAYELQFWRDKVAASAKGSEDWWSAQEKVYTLAGEAERQEVEKAKQAATDKAAADREAANTSIELSKMKLAEERSDLDEAVAAGTITAAQKFATLKKLADDEAALDLKVVQDEIDAGNLSLARLQALNDQKLIIEEKRVEAIAAINRQSAQQQMQVDRQAAQQQQQMWKSATDTITRSFDQMLSGVLQGTQTWQQAMTRLADNLALSFIESAAKTAIEWASSNAERLANTLLTQQGEVAGQAEAEAEFGAIRTAGTVAHAADASKNVMIDAGTAAAGAYQSASQIPYAGWILGPIAAAAAFAATAAFASFDTGAWSLPSDMLAMVHQGEMIIPASIAAQLRGGGSVAPFPTSASSTAPVQGGVQVIFNNNVSAIDGPSVVAHANRYAQTYAAAIGKALQRNPSLRGNY
jgi:hypothetical protein